MITNKYGVEGPFDCCLGKIEKLQSEIITARKKELNKNDMIILWPMTGT